MKIFLAIASLLILSCSKEKPDFRGDAYVRIYTGKYWIHNPYSLQETCDTTFYYRSYVDDVDTVILPVIVKYDPVTYNSTDNVYFDGKYHEKECYTYAKGDTVYVHYFWTLRLIR